MLLHRAILVFGVLAFGAAARAVPIAIENAGFEAPYLGGNLPPQYAGDVPATAFPVGAPPSGWQPYGAVGGNAFVGVLSPGEMAVEPLATYFPAGAPEGDNVLLLFHDGHLGGAEFGVVQVLDATLTAGTRYALSVAVGNIASGVSVVQPYANFGNFDLRGFPGYRIDLLAGGDVIASDNNTLHPSEGTFEISTIQLDVDSDHEQLGEPLAIRLVNLNQADVLDPIVDLEVDFDAISLDASPILPGDFNDDGTVDAADYTVWRDGLDATYTLDHYTEWVTHFGQSSGGNAAIGAASAVPEPTTHALIMASLAIVALNSLRAGRTRCA